MNPSDASYPLNTSYSIRPCVLADGTTAWELWQRVEVQFCGYGAVSEAKIATNVDRLKLEVAIDHLTQKNRAFVDVAR